MDLKQLADILITVGGLALAIMYVTGGFIVNLYLSQYGVTQYQILKVKYVVEVTKDIVKAIRYC
jgi:hypothetical protein